MATNRYCMECEKVTMFVYDKVIRHSYCKECGNSRGLNPENPIVKHFEKKIKNLPLLKENLLLKIKIKKLNHTVSSLKGLNRSLKNKT